MCVERCREVLNKYGIVLVLCKGGNHRAPTVAHELLPEGGYTVHATLGRMHALPLYVAALIHACIRCENGAAFYRDLINASRHPRSRFQLCIGWTTYDFGECASSEDKMLVDHGTEVQALEMDGDLCTVQIQSTGYIRKLPVTWLLPKCICEMSRSV